MLKRKTGRYLLTLLVVTGLAGTINNYSLPSTQRKAALQQMKESYQAVTSEMKGLSPAQLQYRPEKEQPCIRDLFFDLVTMEKELWQVFDNLMEAAPNPEQRTSIRHTDEEISKHVRNAGMPFRELGIASGKEHEARNMQEAGTLFRKNRMKHIRYMKTSTADMRNRVIELPLGWIDGYQLYGCLAAATGHYLQRIRELKATAGFPLK